MERSHTESADPPIRVVVVDDSYLMREAVTHLLAEGPEVEVVATCADGSEVREAVARLAPDVVVTDMRMPPSGDDEGLRISEFLREEHPSVGALILTQHDEPRYGQRLVEGGVEGRAFMLKDRVRSRRELVSAIELVASGGSAIDPRIVSGLMSAPGSSAVRTALATLTPREREVLALMAEGHSNGAIAEQLVLTRHAVEKYVGVVFRKLELEDESEISRRVVAVLRYLDSVA
jgi:DNA-binding NarL/FixJ family response regulator